MYDIIYTISKGQSKKENLKTGNKMKKKPNKNTIQYVLDTTIRKQDMHPSTNNWR